MKKRLLSLSIAMLGVSSLFAYNVGDYIYTRNGRFQVTGENLLVNGDFRQGLETGSIQSMYAGALSADTFAIETEGGPNGLPYLRVLESKSTNWQSNWVTDFPTVSQSTHFYAKVMRQPNQVYVLTYKAKSGFEGVTLTTSICPFNGRSDNYQTFYADENGEFLTPGTKATINNAMESIPDTWTEFAYDYTSTDAGFLHLLFGKLPVNASFADFGIYPVASVADDRAAQECLDQLNFYQQHADMFPNMQDVITDLKGMIEQGIANNEIPVDLINQFNTNSDDDPIKAFLDANAVDITKRYTNFFDGGSGWSNTGGDWGTNAASGTFKSQFVRQYKRGDGSLGAGDYTQTVDLPAGKYLYVVRAQAHTYGVDGSGSSSNYTIPRYNPVTGLRAFVNNDSINMDDVPADRSKVYMQVLELSEGNKTIGFHSPGTTGNGGQFNFDNLQLRIVGQTEEDVERYYWASKWFDANNALTVMRDSAVKVVAMDKYIFGKDVLNDSIAISNNILATATDKTEANVGILNKQMDYMRNAIRAYYTLNAEYVTLADDIAQSKIDVTDETRPKYKSEFNAAISTAEAYYKAVNAAVRDSAGLADADKALMATRLEYYLENATYNTPAELTLVNNTFQKKNATGWIVPDWDNEPKAVWKFGANDKISEGYDVHYARGNSADDRKGIYQNMPITRAGVYQFTAEGAVHNSTWTTPQDTKVYLFAGKDSVQICTEGPGDKKNTVVGKYGNFSVRSVVTTEDMAALNNTLPVGLAKPFVSSEGAPKVNIIYLGACHLKYYGPYDKYLADSMAVVLKPTKDSLQIAINAATELKNEARNPKNVDTTPFATAISTAQAVHDNGNSTLNDVLAQFTALEAATDQFIFSGVWPAKGKYYDHSKLLKNAKFDNEDDNYAGWNIDKEFGDSLRFISTIPGYVYGQFNSNYGQKQSAVMTQNVEGMLEGKYSFAAFAVYRYAWKESWSTADYEIPNTWVALTSNTDTLYVKGLMDGGTLSNPEDTKSDLNYWNGAYISIYSARHWNDANGAPAFVKLFDSWLFDSEVPVTVGADGKATVGFYIKDVPNASGFVAYKPTLRFYGDEVINGIEDVKATVETIAAKTGDIYTITGVKVRANANSTAGLPKGLYIMNGKKFVVK